MDTKLKKYRKLKNLLIALIVLVPALVLVCLYPQMERAMCQKKEEYLQRWQEDKEIYIESLETPTAVVEPLDVEAVDEAVPVKEVYHLQDDFVHYAVETGYYLYSVMLQEATGEEVFDNVLQEHGWINDYYELKKTVPYYARYVHHAQHLSETENSSQMLENASGNLPFSAEDVDKILQKNSLGEIEDTQIFAGDVLGYLVIKYDAFGNLSDIELNASGRLIYDDDLYQKARSSIEQYENNAVYYVQNNMEETEENLALTRQVCPKSFQVIYLITEDSSFVSLEYADTEPIMSYYSSEPYYSPQELYFSIGAYGIVAVCAVFVLIAAMVLPFFKRLETGWEKLFSIPTEIVLIIAVCGIGLTYCMCMLMSVTTMTELTTQLVEYEKSVELLGYKFSVSECYSILLAVNFLGWAVLFFMEYICASQIRQFFCGPFAYLKNRLLIVRGIRWIYKKIFSAVNYALKCEESEKNILKAVLLNFVIVSLLCALWWLGIIGAVVYSIGLFWLLRKLNEKRQKEYQKIYEKAAREEAKSQSMKSELITNVSHDLKTPLTAIITYVNLLKNTDITEEERASYIQTLDLKSQRLKVLIEDLFEVSKANSGNVTMNFMEVDVVQLLKEVRVEMADKIEESNLDFRWNLPKEKILLQLDGQRTYRIFENVLNNALKYAMPNTRVYVDVALKEENVEISFKNISAQELNFDAEHLTERFVRGDSSRKSEGSGLGLAIAKSFTELQKGTFSVSVDGDLFKVVICF